MPTPTLLSPSSIETVLAGLDQTRSVLVQLLAEQLSPPEHFSFRGEELMWLSVQEYLLSASEHLLLARIALVKASHRHQDWSTHG